MAPPPFVPARLVLLRLLRSLALAAGLARSAAVSAEPWSQADVQFFGDVMVNERSLGQAVHGLQPAQIFTATMPLLRSAVHNVVNLEGVITDSRIPFAAKRFLLPMPLVTGELLRQAGIDAVTLANNHSMDFGFQGLLTTLTALTRAGIGWTGAGVNAAAAKVPLILHLPGPAGVCLLAFSRTLPTLFWATTQKAGTALAEPEALVAAIATCLQAGQAPVVAFHWGQEERATALPYQILLAHQAVEAGAVLVLGHHPHRLQQVEFYKGRPILYSLGNYAFGSEPAQTEQEGLAARLTLPRASGEQTRLDLVPLTVSNAVVHFQPRLASRLEADEFRAYLPDKHPCRRRHRPEYWTCLY